MSETTFQIRKTEQREIPTVVDFVRSLSSKTGLARCLLFKKITLRFQQ